MNDQDLGGPWTLELTDGPVPADAAAASRRGIAATVPGVVHTDLLAAGLVADPYLDTHEGDLAWVSETAARYSRTFDATGLLAAGHERVDLVAQGLDTVATVSVNGAVVGRTKNQHRSYRFDVTALLRGSGDEVAVAFDAPLPAARASEARIGAEPLVGDALPYNALRTMASSFGWDWGPTLATAGIWRPIGLQAWSTARLAAVQLDQARAITCAVTHFRSHAPRTSGYLLWQLNDCWPAISWAVVDSGGRRKPLWFALRALNAERLLTVAPRGDGLALVASNDHDRPWRAVVTVRRLRLDGSEIASMPVGLDVAPRSNVTLALPAAIATPGRAGGELLVVDPVVPPGTPGGPGAPDGSGALDGPTPERAWWWFAEDVDLDLAAPDPTTDARAVDGGWAVTVTARSLVKDLALFPDRLHPDAVVDDALVTLLPGESATFTVASSAALDPAALTTCPVLRSVNDLLHPSPGATP